MDLKFTFLLSREMGLEFTIPPLGDLISKLVFRALFALNRSRCSHGSRRRSLLELTDRCGTLTGFSNECNIQCRYIFCFHYNMYKNFIIILVGDFLYVHER
ncbi:uncharacterized protein LOC114314236 [Camellia sinensis]|uniref:uncharacterized protein LOC114314236 n=1 Tax=Camellia sinensis TaxID=4442 RepID=UPI0010362C81|nr:uncharacterized protein LOC114314236 [Camellia sinensis]